MVIFLVSFLLILSSNIINADVMHFPLPELNENSNEGRALIVTNSTLCFCTGGLTVDCAGDTVCSADCNGNFRDSSEADCLFPFYYNGTWYDTCTNVTIGKYWCSVDRNFTGRYALCYQRCPLLARNLVANQANAVHTACLETAPGYVGYSPTDSDVAAILKNHNEIRSNVSVTATNLRVMTWDLGLARLAQRLAENGVFAHDCDACRTLLNNITGSFGQNIFWSSGIPYSSAIWIKAIGSWYSEVKDFTYGLGNNNTGKTIGHYTQIVNWRASRVGCGAAQKGSEIIVACNYASSQYNTTHPYTAGTPCSECGAGNCVNNLCNCTKLCQNYGTLDPVTCTCTCQKWAYGDECEFKTCNNTDTAYGCWGSDKKYCKFSNTVVSCPHLCGPCDYKPVPV